MKNSIIITLLLFFQYAYTQIDTLEFDNPLADSLNNRLEYVKCTMDYPDSLEIEDSSVVVIVSFLMHPDGNFSELNVERGVNKIVDKFVLDFFHKMIRLQPFQILGEKYFLWYAVPVIVSLN